MIQADIPIKVDISTFNNELLPAYEGFTECYNLIKHVILPKLIVQQAIDVFEVLANDFEDIAKRTHSGNNPKLTNLYVDTFRRFRIALEMTVKTINGKAYIKLFEVNGK